MPLIKPFVQGFSLHFWQRKTDIGENGKLLTARLKCPRPGKKMTQMQTREEGRSSLQLAEGI